jgi:hypothetical protein
MNPHTKERKKEVVKLIKQARKWVLLLKLLLKCHNNNDNTHQQIHDHHHPHGVFCHSNGRFGRAQVPIIG